MGGVLAYFLTWTTYGTWLPGDKRGWVHHSDGAWHVPFRVPNSRLAGAAARKAKNPVRFSSIQRRIAEETIRESCEVKGWILHTLNVRSNHVHVVLTAGDVSPEKVMIHLKAYASRRLNAQAGGRRRWWTRHGSTRYIKTSHSLAKAVEYVKNQ